MNWCMPTLARIGPYRFFFYSNERDEPLTSTVKLGTRGWPTLLGALGDGDDLLFVRRRQRLHLTSKCILVSRHSDESYNARLAL